jgi:hypothetical protein
MAGLFLSHASQDKPIVYKLAFDLASRSFPIWFDAWDIQIGHSLTETINTGIGDSEYVLIVISQNTERSSYWVPAEIEQALELERSTGRTIIIPIRLDTATPPAQLLDRVYADFSVSYNVGLERLATELRRLGVDQVDIPLSRRVVPLLIREGTLLQKSVFDQAVRAATGGPQGSEQKVGTGQLRFSPDDAYVIERTRMFQRMDANLSPEQEDFAHAANVALGKQEDILLNGICLIINETALADSKIDSATAAYWFCRILRTTMLWLVKSINDWIDGSGLQPNIYIDPLMRLEEVYDCSKLDRVDLGPRHPSELGMYVGMPLYTDPALGLQREVTSWYDRYGIMSNQEPLYHHLSWHDISKWAAPQLLYRVLKDRNLPITWTFDYWMIGAP